MKVCSCVVLDPVPLPCCYPLFLSLFDAFTTQQHRVDVGDGSGDSSAVDAGNAAVDADVDVDAGHAGDLMVSAGYTQQGCFLFFS